jgi:hypothetical protein
MGPLLNLHSNITDQKRNSEKKGIAAGLDANMGL